MGRRKGETRLKILDDLIVSLQENDFQVKSVHTCVFWTAVITKSRGSGEFSSPMSDEQIAKMFIYSNGGISLHLLFDGGLDTIDEEMLTLWDHFYRELKD